MTDRIGVGIVGATVTLIQRDLVRSPATFMALP